MDDGKAGRQNKGERKSSWLDNEMSKRYFFFVLLLLFLVTFYPSKCFASAKNVRSFPYPAADNEYLPVPEEPWTAPDGFELILSAPAVEMYRKTYPEGTPDYVQVVQLNQGAVVELMYAPLDTPRPGRGSYGGNDARFNLESIQGFWRLAERTSENAFCVSNGSFFYMEETPTRLPFPLKVDGVILTDGYALEAYPDQKLMLELWSDRADIRALDGDALYKSRAKNIIAGLTVDANKRPNYAVGRTFIGLQDRDDDGEMEVMYVLNTQTHTQSGATHILREFGAQKLMMLDGGGSTQLICQGQEYIASGRLIPQAIAIYASNAITRMNDLGDEDTEENVTEEVGVSEEGAVGQEEQQELPSDYEAQATNLSGDGENSSEETQLNFRDVLWVPAIVIPLGVLLVWFFTKVNRE